MTIIHTLLFLFSGLVFVAVAEPAKPEVGTHVDYASPLERLHKPIMETDLFHDRSRYRGQLESFLEMAKTRGKQSEADEKLAVRSYNLAKLYLNILDRWDEKQEDLERIRNDSGLMKIADSEKAQQELEERIARKTGNIASRWESDLDGWRYDAKRELATVQEWQGRLDRAIEAGIVTVRGARRTARSTPPSDNGAPPRPELRYEPEPEEPAAEAYTFTLPPSATRLGENVKTPNHLLEPVKKTADWLEMQQRRIGGKLGTKISASQEGHKVVLNLQVTELFAAQDAETKRRFAETLQQFWATTCTHTGRVRRNTDAHVLLQRPEDGVIALSADKDGSVIKVVK